MSLPPFPTWPPPSGGAPFPGFELGPILNPFPYGSAQTPTIPIAAPPIPHPYPSTFYPKKMPTGANGQNQAPPAGWPTWPHARVNVLPDKASPSISQIQPLPIMGPGPYVPSTAMAGISRQPPSVQTFPAGRFIDGLGTVVTPTRIVGGLGN